MNVYPTRGLVSFRQKAVVVRSNYNLRLKACDERRHCPRSDPGTKQKFREQRPTNSDDVCKWKNTKCKGWKWDVNLARAIELKRLRVCFTQVYSNELRRKDNWPCDIFQSWSYGRKCPHGLSVRRLQPERMTWHTRTSICRIRIRASRSKLARTGDNLKCRVLRSSGCADRKGMTKLCPDILGSRTKVGWMRDLEGWRIWPLGEVFEVVEAYCDL